jgi:ABC-type branched-subunit amino acid transport system substrate-binding protein
MMNITQEEAIPIGGNHMDICRFSGDDERFEAVWKAIRRLTPAAVDPCT